MANKLQKKKTTVQKVVKKVKPQAAASGAKNVRSTASTIQMPQGEFLATVGRRKTASARVRLYKQPGDFIVNGKLVSEYFSTVPYAPTEYNLPFTTVDVQGKYAVSVKVSGSGTHAQLDAMKQGIARALVKLNPEFRVPLKRQGLLTRDDRMKETRKIGTGGKARRAKQSPKR
jgi:small subunit ribosomal protein S9